MPFSGMRDCENVATISHVLGGIGWLHWITFHANNNGLRALCNCDQTNPDKLCCGDNTYYFTRFRLAQLLLTWALALMMVSQAINMQGTHRPLTIPRPNIS